MSEAQEKIEIPENAGLSCLTGSVAPVGKAYELSDAPMAGERLLRYALSARLADMERGNALARALGGRWVRASAGWHLRPRYASCWAALFDAGFSAVRYGYGSGMYSFVLGDKRMGLWAAMRKAKQSGNNFRSG